MKIAAVVVLYNPNLEEAVNNMKRYLEHVDVLLVWNNSRIEDTDALCFSEKIVLCGSGENDYIARPLNYAVSYCIKNGFDWLLTMDQDSKWIDFKTFVDDVESSSFSDVALFAPNVNGRWTYDGDVFVDAENVITSGSLFDVKKISGIGKFREDYKIYWVDGEYCHWIRKNGLRIKVDTRAALQQAFGRAEKNRMGITAYNYSPTSLYFLFRNMFWMHREFGPEAVSHKCLLRSLFIYTVGIIMAEKGKCSKLSAVSKGIRQGLFTGIPQKRLK